MRALRNVFIIGCLFVGHLSHAFGQQILVEDMAADENTALANLQRDSIGQTAHADAESQIATLTSPPLGGFASVAIKNGLPLATALACVAAGSVLNVQANAIANGVTSLAACMVAYLGAQASLAALNSTMLEGKQAAITAQRDVAAAKIGSATTVTQAVQSGDAAILNQADQSSLSGDYLRESLNRDQWGRNLKWALVGWAVGQLTPIVLGNF
ncbi:hypothetical protein LMG19083_04923 [Ralstonia psammae]|uniref:Uncharacterized protein n=1 Tax=Ralstonia psammae TaxID=3058598 RepID=A0ABN9JHH2_9RALS|nr:hypothetical protein [Ralstonia sp. LMG 19083]CAJ0809397.1 hypothetical protein LMG19083_04923 [Ralstonia sp. LMG 19083]